MGAVIGLNTNLDMPVVKIRSGAKPSMFGYPPALEEKKKEDKEKVTTAVLSITNKQKKKEAEKKKGKDGEEKMDVDEKKEEKKEKMEVDEKKEEEKDKKESEKAADEPEPNFELLSNPARVMKAQLKVVSMEDSKYRPMKDMSIGGVIMLDRAELGADEKEEIVEPILVNKAGSSNDTEEEEPAPPEPSQYTED